MTVLFWLAVSFVTATLFGGLVLMVMAAIVHNQTGWPVGFSYLSSVALVTGVRLLQFKITLHASQT